MTPLSPDRAHDPGGKVRTAIMAGVVGDARFSPCGRYRPILTRTWSDLLVRSGSVLWIGMNPSTASATHNDPTITREVIFTRQRLGFGRYVKCNVSDYRATDPKALLPLSADERRSPENLPTIRAAASEAALVIFAFGAIHPCLRGFADETVEMVRSLGVPTHCVGYTKDGFPRHPLYVRGDALLLPYPREAA